MKWRMAGVVVGTVAVLIAGCSEAPSAPTPGSTEHLGPTPSSPAAATAAADDLELSQLTQRLLDLKTQTTITGRITPTSRLELDRLSAAVRTWQTRTGRTDITVSAPQRIQRSLGSGSDGCEGCPIITANTPGKVCFLIEQGCSTGGLTLEVCVYVCFDVKALRATPVGPLTRP